LERRDDQASCPGYRRYGEAQHELMADRTVLSLPVIGMAVCVRSVGL
jgi:hypothetical protein